MKKIIVKKELCDYIDQLQHENNALSDLISFLIKDNTNPDNEGYQYIYQNYIEKNIELRVVKDKLIKEYNIPKDTSWYLEFNTQELTINDK